MPKVGASKYARWLLEVPPEDREWLRLCEDGSVLGVYQETGCQPADISEVIRWLVYLDLYLLLCYLRALGSAGTLDATHGVCRFGECWTSTHPPMDFNAHRPIYTTKP
jgi:hypothetical protein